MRVKMGNPTDQRHFEEMCARALRQRQFQRLLWRELRAIMAEGRKDQSGDWHERYVKLLGRAIRHARLMRRSMERGSAWFDEAGWKPKRPRLRVLKGGKT